jgi:hypothetical protein
MTTGRDYLTGDWELFSFDPLTGLKVETMDLGEHLAVRRTYTLSNELYDANAHRRAESAGQKWGAGAAPASIPLNVYFEKFAEARTNNDSRYIKKLLNDSDYSKFRTKEGKL